MALRTAFRPALHRISIPARQLHTMSTDAIQAKLFARPPPPLEPKAPWDASLKPQIAALPEHRYVVAGASPPPDQPTTFGSRLRSLAALHLANDDIYACHDIVQADEGEPTADLMHALLHRREGDAFNSK
jgi:hypothetical protein